MPNLTSRVARLKCWHGPVAPTSLTGGITNTNFLVEDAGEKYVVRVGEDIPLHQIMRFNELAASKAAFDAGLSPEVFHTEPGILVLRFIDGKTLTTEDVQNQTILARILPVIRRCHQEIPSYLKGPILSFWVFHIVRDYAITIQKGQGRLAHFLPELLDMAGILEKAVGPIDIVLGHNDLLSSNFIDDGSKIWIFDWDYAGFNSPLFDLGGLASNNNLSQTQEEWLLENYFEAPLKDELWHRYRAMKCASLLRESLWSMVSEIHSQLDFDYPTYTNNNLASFRAAYTNFMEM
ncbi:MAG: phosphotransferase [Sneathiella sp.]